jgi:hypothetical protein
MFIFLIVDLVIPVGIAYFYYYFIDKKTIWALPLIIVAILGIMIFLSISSVHEPTLSAKVSHYFANEMSSLIPLIYIPSFVVILFTSLHLLCKD